MTYLTSIRANILSRMLPVALAAGVIALIGGRAHAAGLDPVQLDPITVTAPAVKVVGRDAATGAPIEDVTIKARVQADPAALRTNYGALMLNYSVLDAARKACTTPGPFVADVDSTCVHDAVEAAKPQVDAAIARARSSVKG